MARTRKKLLRQDIEDTAVQASSNKLAQASGPQGAENNATAARSTAPAARKSSQAVGSKASIGKGTIKGNGEGKRTVLETPAVPEAPAATKIRYNPFTIWRPGDPKLESWQFLDKERTGVLKMTHPRYSHDRHYYMLPDGEKTTSKSKGIPKEDRTEMTGEDVKTAVSWSQYFYDALYSHPQAIPKPTRQIKDCRILGLLNGDLIINATSRSRPRGMYWTFNQETRMLQHVKPCGTKRPGGTIKEPEFLIDGVDRYVC